MKLLTLNISHFQGKSFIENLPLDSFLHVFLLLPLPAMTWPLCALVGHPQLDLVVEPAGGEDGQGGVRLEDVHHAVVVARHQFHDSLRLKKSKSEHLGSVGGLFTCLSHRKMLPQSEPLITN